MLWLITNWRVMVIVGVLIGSFTGGWKLGANSVQQDWDADILARSQAELKATIDNQKIIITLEETKNANVKEIDRLRANNHALWLRVPKTPCGGDVLHTTGDPGAAGSGVVSEGTASAAERALNRYDGAYAAEAYRADKLIEDCRVIVEWAKSKR